MHVTFCVVKTEFFSSLTLFYLISECNENLSLQKPRNRKDVCMPFISKIHWNLLTEWESHVPFVWSVLWTQGLVTTVWKQSEEIDEDQWINVLKNILCSISKGTMWLRDRLLSEHKVGEFWCHYIQGLEGNHCSTNHDHKKSRR